MIQKLTTNVTCESKSMSSKGKPMAHSFFKRWHTLSMIVLMSDSSVQQTLYKLRFSRLLIGGLLALFLLPSLTNAQLLVTEDFSYTASTGMVVTNGYTANSGTGTNNLTTAASGTGLSYTGSPRSNVGLALPMANTGEDCYKGFTSQTSGSVYVSALINVSAAGTGDYFFCIMTGTAYNVRLYAKSSGSGYVLGLSKAGATAVYDATVRSFSTTYLVVLKYQFNASASDDVVSLFLDPTLGGTEPAALLSSVGAPTADAASISSYGFRQGSAASSPTLVIDGIMVGTTWASVTPSTASATITPTSAALTGLTYVAGSGPSTATSNTISASTLTAGGGTITFTGSTNFEVSTTNATSGFGATATLAYTGTGTLAANTVWTRLKSGISASTISAETISISGGGATSSFTAAGSVTAAPTATITPTTAALTGLTYVVGSGPSTATANTITASTLTAGGGTITFTGSTNFEVSTTSISTGFGATATLTYTGTGTLAANTVWIRLKAGISASTISAETISISGGGASSSFTAAGSVTAASTITPATAALTGLTYVAGSGPSTATANTITASGLTAGGGTITFSGSTNFEVSTTSISTGFGATATLTYTGTGTLAANTVWTRLKAGISASTISAETINISGGGASSSFTAAGTVTAGVTAFTGGNIVVVKIGNGSATLNTNAAQVAIAEYTTSGAAVQSPTFQSSTTIPSAGSAPFLNMSGQTTNEAFGTTATNGAFFGVLGYNATNGTAAVNGTASIRAAGLANANGTLSIPFSSSTFGNTSTIRAFASDGTNYWGTTSTTGAGNGLAYLSPTGTATTLLSQNSRNVAIYNGQLFFSSQSGSYIGVTPLGTGLPTTAPTAPTLLISSPNPDAFSFNPTHDICYIADEATVGSTASTSGGIRKYTRSSSTWSLAAVFNTVACRGITVDYSGSSPIIYATTSIASPGAGNSLIKITDDGTALGINSSNTAIGSASPSTIVAGAANYRLSGIGFTPGTASIVLSNLTSGTASATTVAPYTTFTDGYTTTLGPIATATSSFTVKAYNLSSNTVTIAAPTNFQVSTSASSGFASSIVLTPTSGSISNQVVYVRLASGLSAGTFTGNVTVKTTTASLCPQWGNVFVTGVVASLTPTITAPASLPTALTGFTTVSPATSAVQTFTFTAINLTSALTITASSPYEISTPSVNSGAYASSLNLGSAATFTGVISVRFAASATAGTYASGTISTSTSDAAITGVTIASLSGTVFSGAFTTGNLAVEVIGDGVTAKSSAACQVNVWEFNTSGVIKNQFPFTPNAILPTVAPYNVTASANATSEGNVGLSADGTKLLVAGYNATIGTTAIASTLSSVNNRVLATLSPNGSKTTKAFDIFNANNARSIASNGYSYWYAGTPTGGAGLYYMFDENSSATAVSLGSVNLRVAKIFNNTFYYSTATTGNIGIFQLGTNGLPITVSNTNVTRLTDATYASVGSPYGFAINPTSDVMYIADDGTFATTSTQKGGIVKYAKISGTWTYQYTLRVLASGTLGARGLEVDWSGANPVIYCVTGASSNASNDLVAITDAGASSTGTSISTASSLYVYRGVTFAPKTLATPKLYCTANLLDFGGQPVNGVSAEKSFNVSGALFTGDITVSVPSTLPSGQYGLSLTSGGPYTNSITISGGAPANATVYMVFRPTVVNTYNGNLSISATGASTLTVPVQGQCILPINYYNASGTDVTNPSNWGTNTDGTGAKPTNFTDNGQYFNLVNAANALSSAQTSASISPDATFTSGDLFVTFAGLPTCPTSPASYYVGATVTGTGIPANTTITSIVGNTVYLSNAVTASTTTTLSVPVSSPWSISGMISKLIVGDGSASTTFTIPATYAYNGTVDVTDNATLVLQNATLPTFGNLSNNSTVNYNHSGSVNVVATTYGNLTLQGSSLTARVLPTSSNIAFPFVVNGTFTGDNVTVTAQSVSPYTFMQLGGDLTMKNGAVFVATTPTTTATMLNVVTTGNGNQTISYVGGGTIRLNTFTSTKSAGTLTLAANTTLLSNDQQTPFATYNGTTLNYSGTAAFVSQASSSLNATGNANINLNFTGTSSFTLGGNLNTGDNSSASFGTTAFSSLLANFSSGTTFDDGGKIITVSGDLGMTGSAAAYNLTGTVVIATRTGTSNIKNNATNGVIVPHLNNFTFAPIAGSGALFQPSTGNATINIDGNFTIGGTATTNKLGAQGNTVKMAGNYANSRLIDMLSAGTSTYEFNGSLAQTFSTNFAGGESFYNVKLNNTNGLTLTNGDLKITSTGNLNCSVGTLTTGTNKVVINATGSISESTSSFVLGTVESTRTLVSSTNEAFGNIGLEINALGSAPGVTTLSRVTGTNVNIGSCTGQSIKRQFNVTAATNSALNATLKFHYLPSVTELNGQVESVLSLFQDATTWTPITSVLNNASDFITATGVNSLSSFGAGVKSPDASISLPTSTSICGAGNVVISNASSTNGTLLWTSSGAGTFNNATIISPTYNVVSGDLGNTVTLTLTSSVASCADATATYSIVAYSVPTVNSISDQSYCAGQTASSVSLSGTPVGVNFDYSVSGSVGLTGNTGVSSIPSFTAAGGSATVTVTPQANGCTGTATNYSIDVTPSATLSTNTVNLCITPVVLTSQLVTVTNVQANTSYTWSPATGLYTDASLSTPYVLGASATSIYVSPNVTTNYFVTATNTLLPCSTTPTTLTVNVCQAITDIICGAATVAISTTPTFVTYNNFGSTTGAQTNACVGFVRDVWYKVDVPSVGNGEIHVTTSLNGTSAQDIQASVVTLFDAGVAGNCSSALVAVACDGNGAKGNMSYTSASGLAGHTVYIRLAAAATSLPVARYIKMAVTNQLLWTGTVSTDFNNAGNWFNGEAGGTTVPNANRSINIPLTTNQPTVNTTANAKDIQVQRSATITLNAADLNFTGNTSMYGTTGLNYIRVNGSGTLNSTGNNNTISGSWMVDNFAKSGAATTTNIDATTGILSIVGVYTPLSGTLTTNGRLTLVSSSSGSGTSLVTAAGQIAVGSGTISGDVTIQRKAPATTYAIQHFISSPITNANTVAQNYGDNFSVVGTYPFQLNNPIYPWLNPPVYPTVIYYDANSDSAAAYRWKSATDFIPAPGVGVSAKMNGNTLFDVKGTPQTGASDIVVPARAGRTNLIGNPYPSTIDLDAFLFDNTANIGGNIVYYLLNGSVSVSYSSALGGTVVNNPYADKRVRFMGHSTAFWAYGKGTAGIRFRNTQRNAYPQLTIAAASGSFFESTPSNVLRLKIKDAANTSIFDETVIGSDANAVDGIDDQDGNKFMVDATGATTPYIYTVVEGQNLVINAMETTEGKVIPMGVITPQAGNFTIGVDNSDAFVNAASKLMLEDRASNKFYNLQTNPTVMFNLPEGNVGSRFYLHVGSTAATTSVETVATTGKVNVYANNSKLFVNFGAELKGTTTVEVFSVVGQRMINLDATSMQGLREVSTNNMAAGTYLVKVTNGENVTTQKVFIDKK